MSYIYITILIDLLVNNGICSSKREAREFLASNSISINGEVINNENLLISPQYLIEKAIIIIRKGKKKYYMGIKKD